MTKEHYCSEIHKSTIKRSGYTPFCRPPNPLPLLYFYKKILSPLPLHYGNTSRLSIQVEKTKKKNPSNSGFI